MSTKRFIYPLVIALLLAAITFAYAAANTVPVTNAGDGQNIVSGYTVSNIHYVLNSTDPAKIDAVQFSLTGNNAAQSVKVQLVSGGAWYDCSPSGSTYTCNVNGAVSVLSTDILRVIAAQ